jgi:penicillin V acylase-like amidase (Ntn superfamily)
VTRNSIRMFAMFLLACGFVHTCKACTTFVLRDGDAILFGRNLDWHWSDGLVLVNSRDIQKTAIVMPGEKPARWTSKYGSVTFNQVGREMPFGGINEVGLVIENMMLLESEYPAADERPAVNMLQWIQYHLDNCRTVNEVLATNKFLRHEPPVSSARIHYMICDANGDSATIEYLHGKRVVHRGGEATPRTLANDTFARSVKFCSAYASKNGDNAVPSGKHSLHRFTRAAHSAARFQSDTTAKDREYAFSVLEDVAQGEFTVWTMVYDVANRKVFYRTRENRDVRWLSLDDIDFAPAQSPKFLDINAAGNGHISDAFSELTDEQHQQYLYEFLGRADVKQKLGNMMPIAQGLIATIKTYRPKAKP